LKAALDAPTTPNFTAGGGMQKKVIGEADVQPQGPPDCRYVQDKLARNGARRAGVAQPATATKQICNSV